MFRYTKSSKRGFTLLETLLAVALLLIVSLIAYEGFMTTLNYSGDTALADRVGNQNAGTCYERLGEKTTGGQAGTTTTGLLITGDNYTGVIQVHAYEAKGGMSIFSSGSSYTDASNFADTTDRHCFTYVARACSKHTDEPLAYYTEFSSASGSPTLSSKKVLVGKCTHDGCTYSSYVRDYEG